MTSNASDINDPGTGVNNQSTTRTTIGSNDPDSPDFTSVDYRRMTCDFWNLTDDLKTGTQAMRDAGHVWLPQEPKEADKSYSNRLKRSFLLNAYRNTISRTTAKPFSKPPTLSDDLPLRLASVEFNIDGTGAGLTSFARNAFSTGLHRGMIHFLIDTPVKEGADTIKDESDRGDTVRIIALDPKQVLNWRVSADGTRATQVTIHEFAQVDDGKYGTKSVERIRIISETEFSIFQRDAGGGSTEGGNDWTLVTSGTHGLKRVPIVTCYLDKESFFTARPVFMDLAWMNLSHWQSNSDQRNILRFARTGAYFAKGFSEQEAKDIAIGVNTLIWSKNEAADFSVVEWTGAAIAVGAADLKDIESQMDVMGLQPLVERSGQQTATLTAVDEGNSLTQIQDWIRGFEKCLTEAFKMAGEFSGEQLAEGFSVKVFSDFGATSRNIQDAQLLLNARAAGHITQETLLKELRRRGIISEDMDIDDEIDLTADEGGGITPFTEEEPNPEDDPKIPGNEDNKD